MTNPQTTYKNEVTRILGQLKAFEPKSGPEFQKMLIKALVECFHVPGATYDSMAQAKVILDVLFGANIAEFIEKYAPDEVLAKSVLTELLYGLYYGGIELPRYKPADVEYLVLQVVAEKTALADILKLVSFDQTVRLICFLFRRPREGTFIALTQFNSGFQPLIFWLKRYYFDIDHFAKLVETEMDIDEKVLAAIVEKLEEHAQAETKELYVNFKELIPLVVASVGDIYKGICQIVTAPAQLDMARVHLEQLKSGFAPYYARDYTLEDFQQFTRLFGLKQYPCIFVDAFSENTSIVEKIKNLNKIVSGLLGISRSIASLMPQEMQTLLSFLLAIIAHLDASVQSPQLYKEGLGLFTCSIATYGKELAGQAAILSLLEGYKSIQAFLEGKLAEKIALTDYPIVIYDQSDDALFEKNNQYIRALNAQYKSALIHISKKQAVALAKKIGAENLVLTTPAGSFGYGGGRNCQYLLTGIIRGAFGLGKKSINEVLSMPKKELVSLFQEKVLGAVPANTRGDYIFMVDDDMLVPEANIFSCALYAKLGVSEPIGCIGFQLGRASKYNLFYWDLPKLLDAPETTCMFPLWLDYQTLSGLSEHLVRPKICLNLPQGNEENHYLSLARGHSFLQPSQHLCGSRYPCLEIPTHFFVGLDQYVEKSILYVLFLYLTDYLLSPKSRHVPTVLPWNENDLSSRFANLRQGFSFIAEKNNQKELKARFWKRVHDVFCDQVEECDEFLKVIQSILALDVNATCLAFEKGNALTESEKESLVKLGNAYRTCQRDVKLFWKFGKALGVSIDPAIDLDIIKEKLEIEMGQKFSDFPITEGLYLMAAAVGRGEFCHFVKTLLNPDLFDPDFIVQNLSVKG